MKRIVMLAMALGAMEGGLYAQTLKPSQVSAAAKSALAAKYPQAAHFKVTWERENGNFEANWGGKSGEDHSVQFSPAGAFVSQELAISVSRLPKAVLDYVHLHYKGTAIHEAGQITDARGAVTYEVEVRGKDLVIDPQGHLKATGSGD